jgi:hypothetical protein
LATVLRHAEMERTMENINVMTVTLMMGMGKHLLFSLQCYRCSSTCTIEDHYTCYGGNITSPDYCEQGPYALYMNLTNGYEELTVTFSKPVRIMGKLLIQY